MNAAEHPVPAEELMAFLDGELTPERASAVQGHLAACDRCQHARAELRGISDGLAEWQVEAAPDTLTAPMASVPPAVSPWRRAWSGSARSLGVAALATAAAAVIIAAPFLRLREASPATQPSVVSLGGAPGVQASPAFRPELVKEVEVTGRELAGSASAMATARPTPAQHPESDRAPMIARTVSLRMVTNDFGAVRQSLDRVVTEAKGYVGRVNVSERSGNTKSLTAILHVPADRLDGALASIKALGKVLVESQDGEDVTEQVTDLDARLSNARNTEKRLVDLLQKRTGDLSDVLAAEREVARVREEIERLDARRKGLGQRVTYATVSVEVSEQEKASLNLGPLPMSARFRNALLDGITVAVQSVFGAAIVILQVGPFLLFWGLVLGVPVWRVVRRTRRTPAAG
jgi:hypothetical protein